MNAAVMVQRFSAASPRLKARVAGVFYLLTFVSGLFALAPGSGRLAANLVASACYVAVTLLFYSCRRRSPATCRPTTWPSASSGRHR